MDSRLRERFVESDGCWEWTGKMSDYGYGLMRLGTKATDPWRQAHRLVFEASVGGIPKGLDLDHLCLNRACVRPDHLEPVTRRVNLLRGMTIPAANAEKTHCPKGHAYAGDNLFYDGGNRKCRTCVNERNKKAARKRAANKNRV